jgi:hypothetical protein
MQQEINMARWIREVWSWPKPRKTKDSYVDRSEREKLLIIYPAPLVHHHLKRRARIFPEPTRRLDVDSTFVPISLYLCYNFVAGLISLIRFVI